MCQACCMAFRSFKEFNPHNNLMRWEYCYTHFTGEETEAQQVNNFNQGHRADMSQSQEHGEMVSQRIN